MGLKNRRKAHSRKEFNTKNSRNAKPNVKDRKKVVFDPTKDMKWLRYLEEQRRRGIKVCIGAGHK